ncbi:hypothetical protein QTN25_003397 [Entamoeba marina]
MSDFINSTYRQKMSKAPRIGNAKGKKKKKDTILTGGEVQTICKKRASPRAENTQKSKNNDIQKVMVSLQCLLGCKVLTVKFTIRETDFEDSLLNFLPYEIRIGEVSLITKTKTGMDHLRYVRNKLEEVVTNDYRINFCCKSKDNNIISFTSINEQITPIDFSFKEKCWLHRELKQFYSSDASDLKFHIGSQVIKLTKESNTRIVVTSMPLHVEPSSPPPAIIQESSMASFSEMNRSDNLSHCRGSLIDYPHEHYQENSNCFSQQHPYEYCQYNGSIESGQHFTCEFPSPPPVNLQLNSTCPDQLLNGHSFGEICSRGPSIEPVYENRGCVTKDLHCIPSQQTYTHFAGNTHSVGCELIYPQTGISSGNVSNWSDFGNQI